MGYHYLNNLFAPDSVVVFGADSHPDTVGSRILENIIEGGFTGKLYCVNVGEDQIHATPCYPSVEAIGKNISLAMIASDLAKAPAILRECGENGIKNAVIISPDFTRTTAVGEKLLRVLGEIRKEYGMHVVGPTSFGIMRSQSSLNATFSNNHIQPGKLALVTRSGAICSAVLDWAEARQIGFSTVISIGEASDVGFGAVLDYLSMDPQTSSILVYVENIRNARKFMSGLRVAARMKPVVAIKARRHDETIDEDHSNSISALSHDDVFAAAFDRTGVVRASNITQLLSTANILASGVRAKYDRLAILSNGVSPALMAADRARDLNIILPELAPASLNKLKKILPSGWPPSNPIDILSDADPERFVDAMQVAVEDPNIDGILILLSPQALTDPTETAKRVIKARAKTKKPVMVCWLGESMVAKAYSLFDKAAITSFRTPESAIEAFSHLAAFRHNQKLLLQVPSSLQADKKPDVEGARLIIEGVLAEGRKTMSTIESRAILAAFRIPVLQATITRSPTEALIAAESAGFPVAMKVSAPGLRHKSDFGGVRLDVPNAHAVRNVYKEILESVQQHLPDVKIDGITVEHMYRSSSSRELLVSVSRDPVFGPAISFGMGGTAADIYADSVVALPPLNSFMIDKMIGKTRIAKMLGEFRNLPAIDTDALKKVLLRISEMVCELPEIIEAELNPLIADEHGVISVDARFHIDYPPATGVKYDHMAIHPYPVDYVRPLQLADGSNIVIRPIRPEDGKIEHDFVRNLSKKSRYMRFMQTLLELTPKMLVRFTQIDYDREMCFIATTQIDGEEVELGVTRYSITPDGNSCEFALVIADDWQRKGLGFALMKALIHSAREKALLTIEGEVIADNSGMLRLMKRLGFIVKKDMDDFSVVSVTLHL